MFCTRHKRNMNNRKICKFVATDYHTGPPTVWYLWLRSLCCCYRVLKGARTSNKKMRSLESHLHINADACLQDAACRSSHFSQPIRVWGFGSVVWKEERLLCIGLMESTTPCGVSLIMHILTRPTLQEGKQKQLKARRWHKRHKCIRENTFTNTGDSSMLLNPNLFCHTRTESLRTEVGT